ncbi:Pre-mRNA-splicing factor SYF2 [Friedmanniomyces endolithicus]|nr:Pre-mRNA-splicing factor SYF2 [Friedmanniomyces endolithicus]KAK0772430.1 Pre-mRNA-splicing factor SYF2 [Friedmanniomyces endolithicus]KAK0772589.1 Pre-mRNA-splicing factor SYF2 [Friedmanniomyces endolithicus]KAK0773482.1 Pre-mRNA-splicing factor SYF2 [Friedmanniomyces endolithicus]KAK0837682.1 Pre-mRNA-splicing factor SYF2 [Friedmanniomyces endolithicus]
MPFALKRKGSPSLEDDAESSKRRFAEEEEEEEKVAPHTPVTAEAPPSPSEDPAPAPPAEQEESASLSVPPTDRASRFAALRARNQVSRKENLRETKSEAKRASTDPTQLTALNRKRDIAQHKLLKAEVEESGEDFERKRAWDWTIEESERWDAKMAEKARGREGVAFQDYSREAGKVYERQVGMLEKAGFEERRGAYEKEKAAAVDRAVRAGGLEIVEAEDGELIAIDKDGSYYSTADSISHVQNKPERTAVDRLVADIKKAEEVRLKKRRERGMQDEGDRDVTYINEKNKQFNMKLARFYDKYTADIRESFERGTAI